MLHLLPTRTGGAAENMAADFLLLQRYPAADAAHARFRHYEWRRAAFTFGFGQKISYVRDQLAALAPDETPELCRRPTGGGVVDHRDDWTYALVIPRGHALYDARAVESYRHVHQALVDALRSLDQPAVLKESCEPAASGGVADDAGDAPPAGACATRRTGPAAGPTVCFVRPELYDVLHADTGAKIAGAAQKRNKHGLLFQGSIAKATVSPALDWDAFAETFSARLAVALATEAVERPWPEIDDEELSGLTEHYASPEWLEYR